MASRLRWSSMDRKMRPNRIYIVPTRYGFAFGAMLAILLLAATLYGNNLVYLLTFVAGTIGIAAMIETNQNLKHVSLKGVYANSCFADEPMNIELIFENRSNRARPLLKVRLISRDLTAEPIFIKQAEARTLTSAILPASTRGRGSVKTERIHISTLYPLGLFYSWTYLEAPLECIIYPSRKSILPRPEFSLQSASGSEANLALGEDFSQHRSYRDGDSIRHVDWKIFARTEEMYVKEFKSGGKRSGEINWDDTATLSFEDRLSQLTFWLDQCRREGLECGLRLPETLFTPDASHDHYKKCLSYLATLQEPARSR